MASNNNNNNKPTTTGDNKQCTTTTIAIADWPQLWHLVGPFSRWQTTIILLVSAIIQRRQTDYIMAGYLLFQSFAGTKIAHQCANVDRQQFGSNTNFTKSQLRQLTSDDDDACHYVDIDYRRVAGMPFGQALNESRRIGIVRQCSRWTFNASASAYKSSIQQDFELVCADAILLPTAQTLFWVGHACGTVLFGSLSDRFGRRPIIALCVVASFLVSMAIGLARSYVEFVVLRALQALFIIGASLTGYVMMMEALGSDRHRAVVANLIFIPFSVGYMTLPLLAYWFQQWRELSLLLALPSVLLFVTFCYLPESPRWLINKQRYGEAERELRRAARLNGKRAPLLPLDLSALPAEHQSTSKRQGVFAGFLDMLRHRPLLVRTACICFNWLANGALYFGLAFYSVEIEGNAYVNFFLGGAVEIPAYAAAMAICMRFGRRWPLALLLLASGLSLLTIFFVGAAGLHAPVLVVALATAGKLFITATFSLIYLYSTELYPTSLRTVCMGVSSTFARVGSGGAPYVQYLGDMYWAPLTPLIFAVVALLAGASTLLLPETRGRELPQTVDDALLLDDDNDDDDSDGTHSSSRASLTIES